MRLGLFVELRCDGAAVAAEAQSECSGGLRPLGGGGGRAQFPRGIGGHTKRCNVTLGVPAPAARSRLDTPLPFSLSLPLSLPSALLLLKTNGCLRGVRSNLSLALSSKAKAKRGSGNNGCHDSSSTGSVWGALWAVT